MSAKTGTGNFALDMAILAGLIIAGVVASVWFSTLPPATQGAMMAKAEHWFDTLSMITVIVLAQPGLFFGGRLIAASFQDDVPKEEVRGLRIFGGVVIAIFGIGLPLLLGSLLSSFLAWFHSL